MLPWELGRLPEPTSELWNGRTNRISAPLRRSLFCSANKAATSEPPSCLLLQASGSQSRWPARRCSMRCAGLSGYGTGDVARRATSAIEGRVATGSDERWVAEAVAPAGCGFEVKAVARRASFAVAPVTGGPGRTSLAWPAYSGARASVGSTSPSAASTLMSASGSPRVAPRLTIATGIRAC